MVLKKTKLSTITAAIATITVMATMGIIGALGQQQQMASAQELDLDELDGNFGEEREICVTITIIGGDNPQTFCSAEVELGPACDIITSFIDGEPVQIGC